MAFLFVSGIPSIIILWALLAVSMSCVSTFLIVACCFFKVFSSLLTHFHGKVLVSCVDVGLSTCSPLYNVDSEPALLFGIV